MGSYKVKYHQTTVLLNIYIYISAYYAIFRSCIQLNSLPHSNSYNNLSPTFTSWCYGSDPKYKCLTVEKVKGIRAQMAFAICSTNRCPLPLWPHTSYFLSPFILRHALSWKPLKKWRLWFLSTGLLEKGQFKLTSESFTLKVLNTFNRNKFGRG